jgi:hypothetical protein
MNVDRDNYECKGDYKTKEPYKQNRTEILFESNLNIYSSSLHRGKSVWLWR